MSIRRNTTALQRAILIIISCLSLSSDLYAEAPLSEQQRFADGLFSRGLFEMALVEYQVIEENQPDYPYLDAVLFRMGESLRKTGSFLEAEKVYQRVKDSFPESEFADRAAFRRAEILVRDGNYLEAINRLRTLKRSPLDKTLSASVIYHLGFSLRRMALTQEAQREFKDLLLTYPDSPYAGFAALELASLLQSEKAPFKEVEKYYTQAAEIGSTDRVKAEALFRLGDLYYQTGKFENAATTYQNLTDSFPTDIRIEEASLQTAWSMFHAQKWATLIELCNRHLEHSESSNPSWAYLLAHATRRSGDVLEAMALYQKMLMDYPDHRLSPYSRYEEALCAFERGIYERVVFRLNQGASWPNDLQRDRIWMLGQAYLRMGNKEKAEPALIHYLELDASGERAIGVIFDLARMLQEREDYEDARTLYLQIQSDYPDHSTAPEALLAAGSCASSKSDYRPAIDDWSKLIELYPQAKEVTQATLQKALAELKLQRNKAALDSLETFLGMKGLSLLQETEGLHWLGRAHEALDQIPEAQEAYSRGLNKEEDPVRRSRSGLRLAALYQKENKQQEAASLYLDMLKDEQEFIINPALIEWTARFSLEHGDSENAILAATKLFNVAQKDSWKQIALTLAGEGYQLADKPTLAKEHFIQALELDSFTPDRLKAGIRLAQIYLNEQEPDAAIPVLEEVVEKSSSDAHLLYRAKGTYALAEAYVQKEALTDAARYFMSVGLLYDIPKLTPQALSRARDIFLEQGKEREALKAEEELTSRYPETIEAPLSPETENGE